MFPFENAKWIFADTELIADLYTDYRQDFFYTGGDLWFYISVDTDYTLYINGQYAASGQYGDFEHYKIYDAIKLNSFLNEGKNTLDLTVYYCGADFQRYKKATAGVIFEGFVGSDSVVASGTHTLSRKNPAYRSGQCKIVSRQLGYTFSYDATKETDGGFCPSVEVEKEVTLEERPTRKLRVCKPREVRSCEKIQKGVYLLDFGAEVVGLATMQFYSPCEQTITVAYGESLTNGRVRAKIHNRNFSFEYRARAGSNDFTNYMLRLGCRFLEVQLEEDIEISYIGLLPQVYVVPSRDDIEIDGEVEHDIYAISVQTLHLCMMEHYVDSPWREQCLYAYDARNQMLAGYRIFEGKNAAYAWANLVLLSEDRREDGLLSICAPSGTSLAIPSFSLYYIIAMYEYAREVHDTSLIRAYHGKIEEILNVFLRRQNGQGLIPTFGDADKWNFYDWSEHLSGELFKESTPTSDLILNCLTVLSLDAYEKMCSLAGISFPFPTSADKLRSAIREEFLCENGAYTHIRGTDKFTALGNALAILSGVASADEAHRLAARLADGEFTPPSLSMYIWVYDALMLVDCDAYRDFILSDIRSHYEQMIPTGTVWETEDGAAAFDGAGSLCHGWSAIPVYIYHRLGIARYAPDGPPPKSFEEARERVEKKFELLYDSPHAYIILTNKTFDGYNGYTVALYRYGDRIVLSDIGETSQICDEVTVEEWEALCAEYGFTYSHYRIEREFRSLLDLYDYIEFLDIVADRFCQ